MITAVVVGMQIKLWWLTAT